MHTQESIDAADAPRLRRELNDAEARLQALQVAASLAADDMERAALRIRAIYVDRGVSDSLDDHATELRSAIHRSQA